jgi:hypothetical protein
MSTSAHEDLDVVSFIFLLKHLIIDVLEMAIVGGSQKNSSQEFETKETKETFFFFERKVCVIKLIYTPATGLDYGHLKSRNKEMLQAYRIYLQPF